MVLFNRKQWILNSCRLRETLQMLEALENIHCVTFRALILYLSVERRRHRSTQLLVSRSKALAVS